VTDAQAQTARREAEALAARLVAVEETAPTFSTLLLAGHRLHTGSPAWVRTRAADVRDAVAAALLAAWGDVLAVLPDARQDNAAYRRGYEDGNRDAFRPANGTAWEAFLDRLPLRVARALDNDGLRSFEALCACTPARLLEARNVGPVTLGTVRAALAAEGLRLTGDPPPEG
jgi:hypothetical protein